ncbi:hypothetical protein BGY98DRAFT_950443, partial [Russula aff. rugulosa BPL654]
SFIPTSDVSYDVGLKERSPWTFDAVSLSLARSKVAINPCSVIPQGILPLFTFQPSRTQEARTISVLSVLDIVHDLTTACDFLEAYKPSSQ